MMLSLAAETSELLMMIPFGVSEKNISLKMGVFFLMQ